MHLNFNRVNNLWHRSIYDYPMRNNSIFTYNTKYRTRLVYAKQVYLCFVLIFTMPSVHKMYDLKFKNYNPVLPSNSQLLITSRTATLFVEHQTVSSYHTSAIWIDLTKLQLFAFMCGRGLLRGTVIWGWICIG